MLESINDNVAVWFIFYISLLDSITTNVIYDHKYRIRIEEDGDNEDGFLQTMPFDGKEINLKPVDYNNLGVDKDSNCTCREYTNWRYTVCYNPENCERIPRELKFKYKALRISNTAIKTIRSGDLAFMNQHLEELKIDGNEQLKEIEPGAFINMTNIRRLSIYQNPQLKILYKDSFQGLDNLEELSVVLNGFKTFYDITQALSPRTVPSLVKLRLAMMDIKNTTRNDFEILSGSVLQSLLLVNCELKYIDPEMIDIFKNLTELRIAEDQINNDHLKELLSQMVAVNSTVKYLSLRATGYLQMMEEYLEIIADTQVSHLILSSFKFDMINQLPRMDKIEYLDLKSCFLLNISDYTFVNLPNLETLILNNNKYSGVARSIILPKVTAVDISDNSINTQFFFNLTSLNYINIPHITHLNISRNNVRIIANYSFTGVTTLKVVDLGNAKIYVMDDNSFAPLVNLEYLDLSRNTLSSGVMRPEIYNGLINLQILILSQSEIANFKPEHNIFVKMPNLRYLSLDGNNLNYLPSYIFDALNKLEYLDVSGNPLKNWITPMFPSQYSLRTMISRSTSISTFTKAMIEDLSALEIVDMRGSKFNCICEEFGVVPNIITKQLTKLIEINLPYCVSPDDFTLIDYMTLVNTTDHCHKSLFQINPTLIPIAILLFCLIAFAVSIFIYRCHIRYWIFLAKLAVSGSSTLLNPNFQLKKIYRYDAFISYSNEDRGFVVRLVEMLENYEPYLKFCVYERDFQIGTVISDTVLESVGDSRRVLLVISDAYIKSQWCRWEVQVAENHRLFFQDEYGQCVNDSLVMIKLGDFSTTNISPMLKYLMKTRIYLQWDEGKAKQNIFWKKLKRALCPPSKLVPVN